MKNNNLKIKVHTSFIGNTGYNAHSRDIFTTLSKFLKLKIRNFTVGKSWQGLKDDPHAGETYLTDYQKSLIGEQTVINNKGDLCDVEIYDGFKDLKNYDIDLVLNETLHHYFFDFDKFKGKFKIAYSIWESTKIVEQFYKLLLKYDQVWCPTEWQKEMLIKQGYPSDKIFVVPSAVDGDIFFPDKNIKLDEYKDNRFKFIVFGRWDYRKSTTELIETFLKTFNKSDPVDLILSVENPYSVDGLKTTQDRLEKYGFIDKRIKVLKFPNREDYINYIKSGHVFLSCARSEGWNLPLIEAFSCGTPSIYSDWGAQLQFAKGYGHPVNIIDERPIGEGKTYDNTPPGNYCEPDFNDLSKVMKDVYINYWKYKREAIKDSEIIRTEFSWENAAKKAYNILNNINTKITQYDNIEEQRKWNNLEM